MRLVGTDVESWKIEPGLLAPPLVVGSFAWLDENGDKHHDLRLKDEYCDWLEGVLRDADLTLVLHNGTFDMAVCCAYRPALIPLVFQAYADGRIRDTQIRQELIDIRDGRRQEDSGTFVLRNGEWRKPNYSLAGLVYQYLGKDRSGQKSDPNGWRLRYRELDGIPLDQWPLDAKDYALEDATDTLDVFLAQGGLEGELPTEADQCRAAWALHLMSAWGIRTNPERVEKLETELLAERARYRRRLIQAGLLVGRKATAEEVREGKVDFHEDVVKAGRKLTKKEEREIGDTLPDGVVLDDDCYRHVTTTSTPMRWAKDTKKLEGYVKRVYERKGQPAPTTETGKIATNKDAAYQSGSRLLTLVADGGGVDKIINTYLPVLKQGTLVPINARFETLKNTARISCREPNLTNLPTGRRVGGVRECFKPREGWGYFSVDLDTAELRSHAQVLLKLFGKSVMADLLNEGRDLHCAMAAQILKCSYEEVDAKKKIKGSPEKKARDTAKAVDFGAPGGLGADSMVMYARANYKVIITRDEAVRLLRDWKTAFPEMNWYFSWINSLVGTGESGAVPHPVTCFLRGGMRYTQACNQMFQHLTAMIVKRAIFNIAWEAYVDKGTVLFGVRPLVDVHDEVFGEAPKNQLAPAAERVAKLMVEAADHYLPDVRSSASPAIMDGSWFKDAEPVYCDDGHLVCWTPEIGKALGEAVRTGVKHSIPCACPAATRAA